jgi:hypothetical protein
MTSENGVAVHQKSSELICPPLDAVSQEPADQSEDRRPKRRLRPRLHRRRESQTPSTSRYAEPDVKFLECAPELVAAIRGGKPRFAHVALAAYLARDDAVPAHERRVLRRHFPQIVQCFEDGSGHLVRWYIGRSTFAAAGLTDRDEIAVTLGRELPSGSAPLVDLIRRAQQVGYTAWHRLHQFDRRQCQDMTFSVIEEAMRQLDTTGKVCSNGCVAPLNRRLAQAEDFMLRCATRRAQSKYLKGMLAGTAATGLFVAATTLGLLVAHDVTRLAGQLLLVATAGAVGAVVSVLWRMTSGSFRMNLPVLNHEMKGTDLRLMGSLRPAIGLVFALASIVLVMGAVIPVEQHEGATQTALFVGMAFLAGFSERFTQDMFARSGQGVLDGAGDPPSVGPSAGVSPPGGVVSDAIGTVDNHSRRRKQGA